MVALSVRKDRPRQGLHYMDPHRDLKEVVDLLQEVFAPYMDSEGRYVLREMRLMARLTSWLGTWVLGPGVYGHSFVGFVWLEEGRVVGHVTVQRLDYEGLRWQIANVAVAEPYRGRGIGRALMEAALEHIRRAGGVWAVLQVRSNNAPAIHLYRDLGFEVVGGEARYARSLPTSREETERGTTLPLVPLSLEHWVSVRDLLARSLGPQARWWRESAPRRHPHPGLVLWLKRLIGWVMSARLGYWQEQRLMALLEILVDRRAREGTAQILVDTNKWGRWEEALVKRAVQIVAAEGGTRLVVLVDLDYEPLVRALQTLGFKEEFALLNMRLRIDA